MSYHSGQTFVYGETPAASKWQYIWDNDASFNDGTGIGAGVLTSTHVNWSTSGNIWWQEMGRATLGSAADIMTISGMTARKYLMIRVSIIASGQINGQFTFNNDTGNNYAEQFSTNLGAVAGATSQAALNLESGTSTVGSQSDIRVLENTAAREKYSIMESVTSATGAGTAPTGSYGIGKWANTSAQITRVDIRNIGIGDMAIGSEVVVLGHD